MTKQETIIRTAGELLGCPYVYGAWGSSCTVALRRKYARLRPAQAAKTYARCQRLREKNPKSSCEGCKYEGRLAFDCRGFVHYVLKAAGIEITGQAVGTQWSSKNWAEKGEISAMPDLIAAVFIRNKSGKWEHVGLHLGGGRIIHCSGEVKEETLGGGRSWTHYAIPAGLYTPEEIRKAHREMGTFMREIMRKGCQGEDVRALQEMLIKQGYSCGGKGADGIYGANTEAAVKAFQAVNGIRADGVAGPQTMALLARQAAPAGESRNEETEQEKPDPGAAQEEPAVPADEGGAQEEPAVPAGEGGAQEEPEEDVESVPVPRQELEQALRALGDIADRLQHWLG